MEALPVIEVGVAIVGVLFAVVTRYEDRRLRRRREENLRTAACLAVAAAPVVLLLLWIGRK